MIPHILLSIFIPRTSLHNYSPVTYLQLNAIKDAQQKDGIRDLQVTRERARGSVLRRRGPETRAREASLQNGGAFASFGNHADQALKRHLRELQARKRGTLAGISAASGGSKGARRTDGKWRRT